MSFNPDLNKQAQEVIFSMKLKKSCHPKVFVNNALVFCANWWDPKFQFHIGIIKKLSKSLPLHSLVTVYKSFMRPHLDYGDIIYVQPNNESFTQKIERI